MESVARCGVFKQLQVSEIVMPLRLDVKKKLLARSDRVKCVDLHPVETWVLVALYNGNVHIWNYENQQLVKSFEVCFSIDVIVICVKNFWKYFRSMLFVVSSAF